MKINIQKEVFDKLDGFSVGVVVSKGVDNKVEEKRIAKLVSEVENMIRMDFIPEEVAKHQLISPWKAAYFDFDERPKGMHSSVEKLMKAVLDGKNILVVNKLKDIANYLSLKHIIPVSIHDSRMFNGDIAIKKAAAREHFKVIGKDVKHPAKGEIIIKDKLEVLCRKFGLEKAEKTRLRKDTKDVVVFVFGLKPISGKKLVEVCKDMSGMLDSFCGGESKYYILNKNNSEVDV